MDPNIDIEEFLNAYTKQFEENTQFLIDQGWTKTDKTEYKGEKVFSVWKSPDGKEYPHQTSLIGSNDWSAAIDVANRQFIKERFSDFSLFITTPEFDEEFNKRNSNNGTIWEEWVYYFKKDSKRVYSHCEALDICRFLNMRDLEPNECCGKTLDIQMIVDTENIELKQDMKLYINFVRNESQYNEEYDYSYVFDHVEYS